MVYTYNMSHYKNVYMCIHEYMTQIITKKKQNGNATRNHLL